MIGRWSWSGICRCSIPMFDRRVLYKVDIGFCDGCGGMLKNRYRALNRR